MADDGRIRCGWCGDDPLYRSYHDEEWGVPERDDRRLFEMLLLEGFQAGLSWITILRKREGFRAAFAGFDPEAIAAYDQSRIETLLQDEGIVRHRGKIEGAVHSARATLMLMGRPAGFRTSSGGSSTAGRSTTVSAAWARSPRPPTSPRPCPRP